MGMGQGLHSKAIMMARRVLSTWVPPELRPLPADLITIADTNTNVINMLDVTGGSVGSEMNAFAIEDACMQLVENLKSAAPSKAASSADKPTDTVAEWKRLCSSARPGPFAPGAQPSYSA